MTHPLLCSATYRSWSFARWLWFCFGCGLSDVFLRRRVKRAIHRDSRRVFAIKIMEKESILQSKVDTQVRKEVCWRRPVFATHLSVSIDLLVASRPLSGRKLTDTLPAFPPYVFRFLRSCYCCVLETPPQTMIMTTLDHPNVVKMYQAMTTISKVVIVMELVTGGELYHEILRHKRLTEDSARHYYRQLIEGLHHCHSHGVYHRDLKVRWGVRFVFVYCCLHVYGESGHVAGVYSRVPWSCINPRAR